jgi:hypothetical protein
MTTPSEWNNRDKQNRGAAYWRRQRKIEPPPMPTEPLPRFVLVRQAFGLVLQDYCDDAAEAAKIAKQRGLTIYQRKED